MSAHPERARLLLGLWVVQASAAAGYALSGAGLAGIPGAALWTLLFAICLLIGAGRGPSTGRNAAANALAIVGLLGLALSIPAGRLMSGAIACLLWTLAGRNLVLGARREVHLMLLGFAAVVVYSASESHSSWFFLVLAVHTLAALAVLSLCWAIRCRESAAGASYSGRHSNAAGLAAFSVAVLALAAAWYLFVPRLPAPHAGVIPRHGGEDYDESAWRSQAGGSGARSSPGRSAPSPDYNGFEQPLELQPRPSGNARSNHIVMHVQSDRALYLRGQTFERFDTERWIRADVSERRIAGAHGRFLLDAPSGASTQVEYIVNVAADLPGRVYSPQRPVEIGFAAASLRMDADGNLRLPAPLRPGVRYLGKSAYALAAGRPAVAETLPDPSPYLQIPQDASPALRALAARVSGAARDALGRAEAIEQHLRTEYRYDLESAFSSQGVIPIERFLFETRSGHCEYFATAMALMLRSVGIPARVATGFSAQNYNPITGFFEVRALDGHAWVEAYLPPHGWVLFEPTPFYALPRHEPQPATSAAQLERYLDALAREEALLKKAGVASTLKALWSEAGGYFAALSAHLWDAIDALQRALERNAAAFGLTLGALATCAVLAYRSRVALARLAARAALAWTLRTRPQRSAIVAFMWACRLMALHGRARAPAETAEEYAGACLKRWPQAGAGLHPLVAAFNDARYGDRPAAAAELHRVQHAFQMVITLLR